MKKIKKCVLISFVGVFFVMSCTNTDNSEKFYVGGTLHKAIVSEWEIATYKNKLATCSDFVANIKATNNESYNGDTALMRKDALELMDCIEESIKSKSETQNLKIAEIAILCEVLMHPRN